MKLSVPIYRLKRSAKLLSRKENIPLHKALNRIAISEGFNNWSLLAARMAADAPVRKLFAQLSPGDLVLLAARPGHGKTLMGLELISEAINQGHQGVFFTLEYNESDVQDRLRLINAKFTMFDDQFEFDDSNNINADYIAKKLENTPSGTIVVVDYLQLLDQKRENPELSDQVQALRLLAKTKGLIIILISQIDRSYDQSAKSFPKLKDVRLPNPLDLALFNKTCFLNNGEIQIRTTI